MISATIITLNEQEKIGKALESLERLAQEIIVVDSGSNDKTLEIAKKLGAKVYHRNFDNFANQKNFALSKTTGDWVLSIDADEQISAQLASEIKEAIKDDQFTGYLIPRRNYILGKEIKYSRWNPDRHIWLWRKNSGKWIGSVHEEVEVCGKIGILKNSKIHKSHETLSSFMKANNFYSQLEAKNLKFSLWRLFTDPLLEFFIRYVYKRGFLDGKEGFILAYMMGVYKLTVWVKAWETNQ